jgi:chemotaxis protein methyltransferase CheR
MPIKPETFQFFKEWAKKRSGILLDGKEIMVESRLLAIADQSRLSGLDGLAAALKAAPDSSLAVKTLEALTTNETFWFRDYHPFEILRTKIIPEILEVRKTAKCFRLWSAASSSGQEPYTIAMILKQYFPIMDSWQIKILATDLSAAMVEKTASGRYDHHEINRGLPAQFLVNFFEEDGVQWRVKEEIRKRLECRTLNLTHDFTLPSDLDVIFIRNVLIYFDAPTKRSILLRALQSLRVGGYLFLGAPESLLGLDLPLESVMAEKTMYYRKRN